MADPVPGQIQHPLSPPPPVYLRSSPPPPPPPPPSDYPPPPPPPAHGFRHRDDSQLVQTRIRRKPLAVPPLDIHDNPIIHKSPLSPVRIDDPSDLPKASSAEIGDTRILVSPSHALEVPMPHDDQSGTSGPRESSPTSASYHPSHKALPYRHRSVNSNP